MKSSIHSTTELARHLGLSRWTVSRALNGHPGIHRDTVARVRLAARQSGFSPNALGRGLRSGKTDWVGVCLPDLEDYFLAPKISRLQEAVAEQGLQTLLQMTNGSEASESLALRRFAALRCRGVVLIASRLKDGHPALESLRELKVPVVQVDPLHPQSGAVVSTDRGLAMEEALNLLHQLGHRRLVAAGIDARLAYGKPRAQGLRQACRRLQWDFDRAVVFLNSEEPIDDFHLGQKLAERFLRDHYPQTRAVVALNDRIACGMIRVFETHQIQVPREVSIIGYDNSAFAEASSPTLTTIDPGVSELIEQAVHLLITGPATARFVKPRLVIRDSTAVCPPVAAKPSRSRQSGSRPPSESSPKRKST